MATKSTSKTPTLKFEEIHCQTLKLLMAAQNFSQFSYSTAVERCKNWDDKFYIRRENQRITDFLSSTILWLSEDHLDKDDLPGNGSDKPTAGHIGHPPFYHPERTDLDHILPSEFIGIRIRVEQFNNHLNGIVNVPA